MAEHGLDPVVGHWRGRIPGRPQGFLDGVSVIGDLSLADDPGRTLQGMSMAEHARHHPGRVTSFFEVQYLLHELVQELSGLHSEVLVGVVWHRCYTTACGSTSKPSSRDRVVSWDAVSKVWREPTSVSFVL